MNLWSFLAGLMPALLQLAQDLFRRHRGDVAKASGEIQRIRDHGARFASSDEAVRAELEKLAEADTKREKPPKE